MSPQPLPTMSGLNRGIASVRDIWLRRPPSELMGSDAMDVETVVLLVDPICYEPSPIEVDNRPPRYTSLRVPCSA